MTKNQAKTMEPMPECDKHTVCFRIQGTITLEDYQSFMTYVENAIEVSEGSFNLLFHYSDQFTGWEPEAADANMRAILDVGKSTRRLAYVNPPEKKIMQHKLAPDLFGGEMKYFSEEQLEEAIAWVKAS